MKKNSRIDSLIKSLELPQAVVPVRGADPAYFAYFQLFNAQRYFDAHDVLEPLWLTCRAETGRKEPDCGYFKGLIQVAGAFVHLQKQFSRPHHPVDARRLRPASRLFGMAIQNLMPYGPIHCFLDVNELRTLCKAQAQAIVDSEYAVNPWRPEAAPVLVLRKEA